MPAKPGSQSVEIPKLNAPRGLRATRFYLGEDELVVFSFPRLEPHFPEVLSASEREVAQGMLEGLSNAAIADMRRTSVRTVANQVASIFRKLGISSRAELPFRLLDPLQAPDTTDE